MNAPTTLTHEQSQQLARERSIEHAERDLPIIEQLLDSTVWQYFARRLRDRRTAIRDKLADDDNLTGRETRALRAIVKEYDEILRLPHQDRAVHTATLAASTRQHAGPSRG